MKNNLQAKLVLSEEMMKSILSKYFDLSVDEYDIKNIQWNPDNESTTIYLNISSVQYNKAEGESHKPLSCTEYDEAKDRVRFLLFD